MKALVEFVLFHCGCHTSKWGFGKLQVHLLQVDQAILLAEVVSNLSILYNAITNHSLLVASACRSKVVGDLKKRYKTPKDAEKVFFQDSQAAVTQDLEAHPAQSTQPSSTSCSESGTQSDALEPCAFKYLFGQLSGDVRLAVLSELFVKFAKDELNISVPEDFLLYAAEAMMQLNANGRGNILYKLAKGIGTLREDGQESRFPIKRMPMGLIEYSADFFAADNLQSLCN